TIDYSSQGLYLVKPVIENPATDIQLLTATQVSTETGNPMSITDDGSLIIFVDDDNNLRSIQSDGSGEVVESSEGVWRSIALSPNGNLLAATTIFADSSIYIFDLSGNDNHKKIRLYSPTTQENVRNYTTVLADAMDWNLTSEYLIFDSFTSIPQANGGNLEYWTINVLDPAEEIIMMLFPPQPQGVSIGNPSFGHTNDIYFVFDYMDYNQGICQVRSANLFTGEVFLIEDNETSIGYPRYSPDDQNLVFQRWQSDGTNEFPTLRQIALTESKTQPAGSSRAFVNGGMLPTWFAIGSRPTEVELPGEATPTDFNLKQNYPNPFNPETVISYRLPFKGKVRLTAYNILGKEVAVLAQGEQEAGMHQVTFDGSGFASGIYMYRLETNNAIETRRMVLLK
ncbi:T9SS type A sorting domain-containing protein, partial [candidate division KSB1 bacterium]|nr:T9SS type A sorting domain-containing protein [candidate division KSB1 bacterium]